jgi:hypothetical protein
LLERLGGYDKEHRQTKPEVFRRLRMQRQKTSSHLDHQGSSESGGQQLETTV